MKFLPHILIFFLLWGFGGFYLPAYSEEPGAEEAITLEDLGGLIKKISNYLKKIDMTVSGIIKEVSLIWKSTNDWFDDNLGASLVEIIRMLGNALLWILNLTKNIIEFILSKL